MKVKALITLAVGKDKEIPVGSECELEAKEALRLSKLGFVQIIKLTKDEKGSENGSSSGKSGQ